MRSVDSSKATVGNMGNVFVYRLTAVRPDTTRYRNTNLDTYQKKYVKSSTIERQSALNPFSPGDTSSRLLRINCTLVRQLLLDSRIKHFLYAKMKDMQAANMRAEDNLGRQALHLAAQSGATESVRYLVSHCDISPNTVCERNQLTALHYAAKEGQVEVIRQLLSLGACADLCDTKGRTALHIAFGAQHAACVAALLQHGAGCQPDLAGTLPQQLARKPEVTEVFQQHGVT